MKILILAEGQANLLSPQLARVVTAARQLGEHITVGIAGAHTAEMAQDASQLAGVTQVLTAEAPHYEANRVEELIPLWKGVAVDYDVIVMSSSTTGKNLLPRLAATLDYTMVSEVLQIHDPYTFDRPIYAGNLVATVKVTGKRALTVRPTVFAPTGLQSACDIQSLPPTAPVNQTRLVSQQTRSTERPDLQTARVVVAGGRGLGDEMGFELLQQLADHWTAAVGATRAAVDTGLAPNDWQIGQTGKVIGPDFYLAVGISGAIQHLAGIKDSKVIAAINSDPDAPIFQIADIGLVGDAREALSKLLSLPPIKRN